MTLGGGRETLPPFIDGSPGGTYNAPVSTWINAIVYGQLAPSLLFASESAAREALDALLKRETRAGRIPSAGDIAGIPVWTVRNADGSIHASYWLSGEEHGPAMHDTRA